MSVESTPGRSPRPGPLVSRRTVLVVGAAGVGAVSIAACAANGSAAGSGSSPAPVEAGQSLVALSAITLGEAVSRQLKDGSPVLVSRPTDTSAACFSAICTHEGCTVAPAGQQLRCPCHGSVYDATTGAVIRGPAPRPLPQVAVHVADGDVVTGASPTA
jgi:Rieske Fe-S protein